jgi:hypothetical protein
MVDMTGINVVDRKDLHTSYALLLNVRKSHNHAVAEVLSVTPSFQLYHISICFGSTRDIISLPELKTAVYASWKDDLDSLITMTNSLADAGQDLLFASSIAIAIDLVYRIVNRNVMTDDDSDLLDTDDGYISIPDFLENYRFIGDTSLMYDDLHNDSLYGNGLFYLGYDDANDDLDDDLPF